MKFERATTTFVYIIVWVLGIFLLALIAKGLYLGFFAETPEQESQRLFQECYYRCVDRMQEANPHFDPYQDERCMHRCIYIYQEQEIV